MTDQSQRRWMFDIRVYTETDHVPSPPAMAAALRHAADALETELEAGGHGGWSREHGAWNLGVIPRPPVTILEADGLDGIRGALADSSLLAAVDVLMTRCALLEDELRRRR